MWVRRNHATVLLGRLQESRLVMMDHLRAGIGLQGNAQIDPKVAYEREGMPRR